MLAVSDMLAVEPEEAVKCAGRVRLQQLTDAAVTAAEAGDFAAAVVQFSAALQLHPDSATLHEQYAQCLMELEEYGAAVTAAETATVLEPGWPEGWLTLARCYLNNGQLQSAHQTYSRSLVLCPAQPDVVQELSDVVQLMRQQVGRLVGLPGLAITADPAGQLGPGCVIWEAGIQLAKLLVANNGHTHQNRQQSDGPRIDTAEASRSSLATPPEPTAAASKASASLSCLPSTAGAHVLEVGSGTGIVGITAAALGAHVTLTDLPELLPLVRTNIAASQGVIAAAGGSAAAAALDWNTLGSSCSSSSCDTGASEGEKEGGGDGSSCSNSSSEGGSLLCQHWDWCIGADLVFNARQVKPVVQLISAVLQQHSSQQGGCKGLTADQGSKAGTCAGFLLAHKHRHQQLDEQLLQELQLAGLQVQVVVSNSGQQCVGDLLQPQQQQPGAPPTEALPAPEPGPVHAELPSPAPAANPTPTCLHTAAAAAQDCSGVGIWWITRSAAGDSAAACAHVHTSRHAACKHSEGPHAEQQQQQQEAQQQGGDSQQTCCSAPAYSETLQQQQQQGQQQQHTLPNKKVLLLSAGLAGVGKSTILQQLSATLAGSVYLDKDTVNAALLRGQPYFSDYYKQHVQEQTYAVLFGIAADNLAAHEQCVVILDGQFGDKLSAGYVKPFWRAMQQGQPLNFAQQQEEVVGAGIGEQQQYWNATAAVAQQQQLQEQVQQQGQAMQSQQVASGGSRCWVALLLFECCADLQLQRLRDRGLGRDMAKYACFDEYRSREVQLIEQQLLLAGGQLDAVIRVDTSRAVAVCANHILSQLQCLLMPGP